MLKDPLKLYRNSETAGLYLSDVQDLFVTRSLICKGGPISASDLEAAKWRVEQHYEIKDKTISFPTVEC